MGDGINMSSADIYIGIVADFEGAWLGLSRVTIEEAGGRGNFMFARQAMVLLEFICRLTSPNATPTTEHVHFCEALHSLEPRYFGELPGTCASEDSEYVLPFYGPNPERQLIRGVFDLMRNGGAHQYQQIPVTLADDRSFGISIGNGSWPDDRPLGDPRRRRGHLVYQKQPDATWLAVSPDTLFLDIKEAAESAGIPGTLTFPYLQRGKLKPKNPTWKFSEDELLESFRSIALVSLGDTSKIVRNGWTGSS